MNKNSFIRFFLVLTVLSISFQTFAAVKLGSPAPDFTLTSVDGKKVSLADYKGKVVVLEWFNYGCPFVQKHYKPNHMQALQTKYAEKGVVWLSINSTNPKHQDYLEPAKALEQVKSLKMTSTLLADPSGEAGKLYEAKTTPQPRPHHTCLSSIPKEIWFTRGPSTTLHVQMLILLNQKTMCNRHWTKF
jgi:peroxiredoxin